MSKESLQYKKQLLRKLLLHTRKKISTQRRTEASFAALKKLTKHLPQTPHILSFASFGSEIDIWPLNKRLQQKGLLALPRVNGAVLEAFSVPVESSLVQSHYGALEPLPLTTTPLNHDQLSVILVPALGFDKNNHRIGFGKGFFDRFLSTLPSHIQTIGIGFKEQQHPDVFPVEKHHIPLTKVCLF